MLLSHTVLSELYQEKLVTEDEVKRMITGYLHDRIVGVQFTKPPEVLTGTTDILNKFGFNEVDRKLKGW